MRQDLRFTETSSWEHSESTFGPPNQHQHTLYIYNNQINKLPVISTSIQVTSNMLADKDKNTMTNYPLVFLRAVCEEHPSRLHVVVDESLQR